jgi:hypothetical protein
MSYCLQRYGPAREQCVALLTPAGIIMGLHMVTEPIHGTRTVKIGSFDC